MNLIVERRVDTRGLIDLALDAHRRYPDTYFEVLDDETRLTEFDQASDLVETKERLGSLATKRLLASLKPWEQKHYLATIAVIADNGVMKWQLLGSDAHPTDPNGFICNIDPKPISISECVSAARNPR